MFLKNICFLSYNTNCNLYLHIALDPYPYPAPTDPLPIPYPYPTPTNPLSDYCNPTRVCVTLIDVMSCHVYEIILNRTLNPNHNLSLCYTIKFLTLEPQLQSVLNHHPSN